MPGNQKYPLTKSKKRMIPLKCTKCELRELRLCVKDIIIGAFILEMFRRLK